MNWYFENFFGNKAGGGGSLKNPHGQRGGSQNVHICPQGGRRDKKNPKKLSTRFVDDPLVIFLVDFLHEAAPGRQT